jgi:hypothetical protein
MLQLRIGDAHITDHGPVDVCSSWNEGMFQILGLGQIITYESITNNYIIPDTSSPWMQQQPTTTTKPFSPKQVGVG